jgi:hypothetical protein
MPGLYLILTQGAAPTEGLKYSEFLAITLTALAVILASIGIFIAILAIWGYKAIRDEAARIASKTSVDAIRQFLAEANIKSTLRDMVAKHVKQESDELWDDIQMTGQANKLTETYPTEKKDEGG